MAKSLTAKAQYFQHASDLRNNIKVRALRRRYGNVGYAVMCYLFEMATERDEFTIHFSDMDKELLAADFDVKTAWLDEFVNYCSSLQIFTVEGEELTSGFLKEVFKPLFSLREKRAEIYRKNANKRWGKEKDESNSMQLHTVEESKEEIRDKSKEEIRDKSKEEERRGEDIDLINNNKEDNSIEAKASTSSEKTDDAQGESFNKKGFIEFFNKTMNDAGANIPRIESIQGRREAAIKARISEYGKAKVMMAIEIAAKSQFLNGGGDKAFIASCDWIMRPNNFPKVVEGNYNTINNHANGDSDQGHNRRRGVETTATCAEDYRNSSF